MDRRATVLDEHSDRIEIDGFHTIERAENNGVGESILKIWFEDPKGMSSPSQVITGNEPVIDIWGVNTTFSEGTAEVTLEAVEGDTQREVSDVIFGHRVIDEYGQPQFMFITEQEDGLTLPAEGNDQLSPSFRITRII